MQNSNLSASKNDAGGNITVCNYYSGSRGFYRTNLPEIEKMAQHILEYLRSAAGQWPARRRVQKNPTAASQKAMPPLILLSLSLKQGEAQVAQEIV